MYRMFCNLFNRATYFVHSSSYDIPLVYWWNPFGLDGVQNFGDKLGPEVVKRYFGLKYQYADIEKCNLVTIGSILNIVNDIEEIQNIDLPINVWGSGFIQPPNYVYCQKLRFCAVRGLLTKRILNLNTDIALGDPGLLASLVYPKRLIKSGSIIVIPHHSEIDLPIFRNISYLKNVKIVSPLNEPDVVVKEISQACCVLSSSLHGLIVADSFRIPNARLILSNNLTGGDFKFEDYNSIFDREQLVYKINQYSDISSICEEVIHKYKRIPNLNDIQHRLISAFPLDCYK